MLKNVSGTINSTTSDVQKTVNKVCVCGGGGHKCSVQGGRGAGCLPHCVCGGRGCLGPLDGSNGNIRHSKRACRLFESECNSQISTASDVQKTVNKVGAAAIAAPGKGGRTGGGGGGGGGGVSCLVGGGVGAGE